jgi:polysaccharide export outer membrane protein
MPEMIPRFAVCALVSAAVWGSAQNQSSQATPQPLPTYVLGIGDQISVQGLDIEEFSNKPVRIDDSGDINLPMLGRVHAAGLTLRDLEGDLSKSLSRYVKRPEISVSVVELRSQPVSVLGAVNSPGVHQLQRGQRLVDMLSVAGGLRQDAGYTVKITRQGDCGPIPLPGARRDLTGQFSVADVSLRALMHAENPEMNIPIMPRDVLTVPRAEMIYVIGEVRKSGGFVLGEKQTVSVLQALSLAEGLERTAAPSNARILRQSTDGEARAEVAVNVKRILSGKSQDMPLQGDDILFIPGSTGKKAFLRGVETAIQTGSGIAIWRSAR